MSNIVNISSYKNPNNTPYVKGKKSYYRQDMYYDAFYEEKEFSKFAKNVERCVRTSDEYSSYLGNLKNTYELDSDAYMNDIKDDDASIEFHHYPFTLYDIVTIITSYMLKNKIPVSSLNVAEAVMEEHYSNRVGLIPLSKTVHQLAHSGEIFIPLTMVFGRYDEFITRYRPYMSNDIVYTYNEIVKMTKMNATYSTMDILEI